MRKNYFNKKGTLVLFLTAIFLFTALNKAVGQTDSLKAKLTYKNQLKFSLTTCVFDNLKFDNTGEKLIKSLPMPGGELTLSYFNYLKNGYGLNVGLGVGLAPFNVFYNERAANNNYRLGPANWNEFLLHYYTLPLSIQKSFKTETNKKIRFAEAGIKLNYIVAYPFSIQLGESIYVNDSLSISLFDCNMFNTKHRTIVGLYFKYGWQKLLKDQNTFQYNFVLHYSPTKIGKGTYEFFNLPNQSYGTVAQNINFIGFEIAYGLTTSRRLKE